MRKSKTTEMNLNQFAKVRVATLDKLSESVADFGRHLRSVFHGTSYGIDYADDFTQNPQHSGEKNWIHASFELYHLSHGPEGQLTVGNAGAVQISTDPSTLRAQVDVFNAECDIEQFKERIRNYDLSGIEKISYIP